jgi:hypothetical protein
MKTLLDQTNSEYFSDTARLSASELKVFAKSPREYWETFIAKTRSRPEMRRIVTIGSLAHDLLLRPDAVDDEYRKIPTYALSKSGARAGKVWNQWQASQPERIELMTPDEWRIAEGMAAALRARIGGLLREATAMERVVHWECPCFGFAKRAKLDVLLAREAGSLVIDIKTTGDLDGFCRVYEALDYWIQEMHYREAAREWSGQPVAFLFCVVSRTPPHEVIIRQTRPARLAEAETAYGRLCERFAHCLELGEWPDLVTSIETAKVPVTSSDEEW